MTIHGRENPMKLRVALALLVLASASSAPASGVHFGIVEDSDSNHYYRSRASPPSRCTTRERSRSRPTRKPSRTCRPGPRSKSGCGALHDPNGARDGRRIRETADPVLDRRPDRLHRGGARFPHPASPGGRPASRRSAPRPRRGACWPSAPPGSTRSRASRAKLPRDLSGRARRVAVAGHPAIGKRAVEVAGHEISSAAGCAGSSPSSPCQLPPDPAITSALARACAEISSSSERGGDRQIARARDLGRIGPGLRIRPAGNRVVVGEIGRDRALRSARPRPGVDRSPGQGRGNDRILVETRRALEALAAHPNLRPRASRESSPAGTKIASSSEKSSFLVACARAAAPAPEPRRAYLAVARTIESSSETRRALSRFCARVSPGTASRQSSPPARESTRAPRRASCWSRRRHSARRQRLRRIYRLRGVDRLVLRKRRAIRALLASGALSPDQRKAILDFAEARDLEHVRTRIRSPRRAAR